MTDIAQAYNELAELHLEQKDLITADEMYAKGILYARAHESELRHADMRKSQNRCFGAVFNGATARDIHASGQPAPSKPADRHVKGESRSPSVSQSSQVELFSLPDASKENVQSTSNNGASSKKKCSMLLCPATFFVFWSLTATDFTMRRQPNKSPPETPPEPAAARQLAARGCPAPTPPLHRHAGSGTRPRAAIGVIHCLCGRAGAAGR